VQSCHHTLSPSLNQTQWAQGCWYWGLLALRMCAHAGAQLWWLPQVRCSKLLSPSHWCAVPRSVRLWLLVLMRRSPSLLYKATTSDRLVKELTCSETAPLVRQSHTRVTRKSPLGVPDCRRSKYLALSCDKILSKVVSFFHNFVYTSRRRSSHTSASALSDTESLFAHNAQGTDPRSSQYQHKQHLQPFSKSSTARPPRQRRFVASGLP